MKNTLEQKSPIPDHNYIDRLSVLEQKQLKPLRCLSMCACLCVYADGSGTSEREKGMRTTSKTKKKSLKTADVL